MYRLLQKDFSLKKYAKQQIDVAVFELSNLNALASRLQHTLFPKGTVVLYAKLQFGLLPADPCCVGCEDTSCEDILNCFLHVASCFIHKMLRKLNRSNSDNITAVIF